MELWSTYVRVREALICYHFRAKRGTVLFRASPRLQAPQLQHAGTYYIFSVEVSALFQIKSHETIAKSLVRV